MEGQEFMVRTYSHTFYWSSTNKGSFSTDMSWCSFHLLTDTFFCTALYSEISCGPPGERRRTTVWQTQLQKWWQKWILLCSWLRPLVLWSALPAHRSVKRRTGIALYLLTVMFALYSKSLTVLYLNIFLCLTHSNCYFLTSLWPSLNSCR
jgi:hypothetical protein